MGRPLKEVPEAKIEEVVSEVNGNVQLPLFNDLAFAVVFDKKNNKYAAVKIPFDFETQTSGTPIVVEENTDKRLMEERLQVLIWQNL